MIKELIDNLKNIEKNILTTMYKGIKFSYGIEILSCLVLLFYISNPITYEVFESGIILFRISLIYAICFIICGIFVNKMKKDLN